MPRKIVKAKIDKNDYKSSLLRYYNLHQNHYNIQVLALSIETAYNKTLKLNIRNLMNFAHILYERENKKLVYPRYYAHCFGKRKKKYSRYRKEKKIVDTALSMRPNDLSILW